MPNSGTGPQEGNALRWLSQLVWQAGVLAEAKEMALRAVAILEPVGPAWPLVVAYCHAAELMIADEDPEGGGVGRARLSSPLAWRAAIDAGKAVEGRIAGQAGGLEKLEECVGLYEAAGLEAAPRAW